MRINIVHFTFCIHTHNCMGLCHRHDGTTQTNFFLYFKYIYRWNFVFIPSLFWYIFAKVAPATYSLFVHSIYFSFLILIYCFDVEYVFKHFYWCISFSSLGDCVPKSAKSLCAAFLRRFYYISMFVLQVNLCDVLGVRFKWRWSFTFWDTCNNVWHAFAMSARILHGKYITKFAPFAQSHFGIMLIHSYQCNRNSSTTSPFFAGWKRQSRKCETDGEHEEADWRESKRFDALQDLIFGLNVLCRSCSFRFTTCVSYTKSGFLALTASTVPFDAVCILYCNAHATTMHSHTQ